MNELNVHIENASGSRNVADEALFLRCAQALGPELAAPSSLCLRIVDADSMAQMNQQFRGKAGPTNVLSFPAGEPLAGTLNEEPDRFLGDLAICAELVRSESAEQGKSEESHWAHLFIHGTLHLLGYDHIEDEQAEAMESLETRLMQSMNYPPPYDNRAHQSQSIAQ